MQDRYLFKAKRKDSREWVFGGLSYCDKTGAYFITNMGKYHISYIGFHQEVDPDTICQCTGLKDKNGNLIWENDIVFVSDADGCSGQMDTGVGKISFIEGLWYIEGRVQNGLYDIDKCFQIEVIGNKFDNPELLEV